LDCSLEKQCSACIRIVRAVVCSMFLFPGIGVGGSVALAGTLASSDPAFKALLIDGRTVSGRLVSLGPGAIKVMSIDGSVHELPLDSLIKLTREFSGVGPALDTSHVILPDGDCIMRVSIESSTDTSLQIQSDVLGKVLVPLDGILGLIFAGQSRTAELDPLWELVRAVPRTTEVVWLANGDRLAGGFLGLNESKIKLQVSGKPVEVDRPGVVALGFDPTLVSYPRPKSDFLELTLKDGSRLGVTESRIDDSTITATTRYGGALKFSLNELVRVHARSRTVVYLSERRAFRDQYLSYVGPTREYRVDRTVDGHLFHLGGQAYDRGLGTQSTTYLVYPVEPGDRSFQALVGVDERAGPLGSVVFRVLVDGKERFKTPAMTDHDPPTPVDVDLDGAKYVILATEFGDRGDVRDLADWVEARMIR
jgi:NPCBM/NEW2 domain